jgi:hypothetical protein
MISVFVVLFIQQATRFLSWFKESCTVDNIKSTAFRLASTYIPQVKNHIDKELLKLKNDSIKKYSDNRKGIALKALPSKG